MMKVLSEEKMNGISNIEQPLVDQKNGLTDLGKVRQEELSHSLNQNRVVYLL